MLGPYTRKDNRKHFVVFYSDGTRGSKSYSKWLLEQKIGRAMESWETADHIDEDKTNDDLENLQVLSLSDNVKKHHSLNPTEMYYFFCPCCGNGASKPLRNVKGNWKKGKGGPYCSRSCSGKHKYVPPSQRVSGGLCSLSKRNSSGTLGVWWSYYAEKNLTYACASWRENGKDVSRKFSVLKYGLLPAWKMAVESRINGANKELEFSTSS